MPQITVETEAVRAAGQKIQALSNEIEGLIGQLQTVAASSRDYWQGTANAAFETAMQDWNTAAVNIKNAASTIGNATMVAGSNYQDTEAANTKMFG
ncbi:MAG: WXG100 family type VII secretion target [Conexibacteraceae bacterium]|nr:WXG100 family type VII secretion target [Conexibacteraceae bacterium]